MRTLSSLQAGIIGTGFIAPVHIESLLRLGVRVCAVCGSTDSAASLAERWGIETFYGDYDYEAMLADPLIDVVHVASPNAVHVEQSLAALAAGKHVLCEKPLGMNTTEARRLVKAASQAKTTFAVNYLCRFFPAVLQMRALVRRGELGRIAHVEGHFFQDWLLHETDYNWRVSAEVGGPLRAVGDIGTHWMDAVSFILGAPIERVMAQLHTLHPVRWKPTGNTDTFTKSKRGKAGSTAVQVDTEDIGNVLLEFGQADHAHVNQVPASVCVSQVAAGWKCSLAIGIYGTLGSVRWDMQQPNEIILGRRDEPNQILQRGTPGFDVDVADYTDYPGGHSEGFGSAHKMHYRAVYRHIATKSRAKPLFATAEDGYQELKVCEAILRSAKKQRWESV